MRFKKRLFPDKPLERRLDKFSPKTTPLKLRGNENEIMKFLGFPKSGDKIQKYISPKKKKFSLEIFLRENFLQILEKIQDFIFVIP